MYYSDVETNNICMKLKLLNSRHTTNLKNRTRIAHTESVCVTERKREGGEEGGKYRGNERESVPALHFM